MLGEKALDLVKDAARNENNLNPFNEDLVRATIEETRRLWEQNRFVSERICPALVLTAWFVRRSEVAETGQVGPSTTLKHSAIERNKRCLLAYLNHRTDLITAMRWQFGAVLPEEVRLNMCEPELEFFSKYNKSLAVYMRSVGTDLTTDFAPPKSLYVEVRVLQDHGEIETAEGEVRELVERPEPAWTLFRLSS